MNDLVLCASCSRHVRRTEERCPFCGTALAANARRARPAGAPAGLSRARLYAFHAAVATSVAAGACGGSTVTTSDGGNPADAHASDGSASDGSSTVDAANDAASEGATGGDGSPESSTVAESGVDSSIHDAGSEDGWGPPPPPYGCVFPEGCGDVKV